VVTLGRGHSFLTLWSLFDLSKPVFTYKKSKDDTKCSIGDIQQFCWQIIKHVQTARGAQKSNQNARYHLVSWGKDWNAHVWNVSKRHQEACYFTKSLLRTRAGSLADPVASREPSQDEIEAATLETKRFIETDPSQVLDNIEELIVVERKEDRTSNDENSDGEKEASDDSVIPSPTPSPIITASILDLRQEFDFAKLNPIPNLTIEVNLLFYLPASPNSFIFFEDGRHQQKLCGILHIWRDRLQDLHFSQSQLPFILPTCTPFIPLFGRNHHLTPTETHVIESTCYFYFLLFIIYFVVYCYFSYLFLVILTIF